MKPELYTIKTASLLLGVKTNRVVKTKGIVIKKSKFGFDAVCAESIKELIDDMKVQEHEEGVTLIPVVEVKKLLNASTQNLYHWNLAKKIKRVSYGQYCYKSVIKYRDELVREGKL